MPRPKLWQAELAGNTFVLIFKHAITLHSPEACPCVNCLLNETRQDSWKGRKLAEDSVVQLVHPAKSTVLVSSRRKFGADDNYWLPDVIQANTSRPLSYKPTATQRLRAAHKEDPLPYHRPRTRYSIPNSAQDHHINPAPFPLWVYALRHIPRTHPHLDNVAVN